MLGSHAFDGVVYDPALQEVTKLSSILKTANPMVTDGEGKTPGHAMALSGLLSYHTEAWHSLRLGLLKKRGADLRVARDVWGRAPMLSALEEGNVAFIRGLLKTEVEMWFSDEQLRLT